MRASQDGRALIERHSRARILGALVAWSACGPTPAPERAAPAFAPEGPASPAEPWRCKPAAGTTGSPSTIAEAVELANCQHFPESDENPTRADMREMAKELDSADYVLQAGLTAADGCTPVWARRADLPPPIVFARGIDDPALRPRVLEHMKTLRGIRRMSGERKSYLRELDAEERRKALPWAAFLDAQLKLVRWDEIGGTRGFLTAQVTHDDGCGGFNPDPVTMLFELSGDILTPHADPGFLDPIALMDVDRDGHLEAVTGDATKLETRGPKPLAFSYSFPAVFCPC